VLVDCPHFRTERWRFSEPVLHRAERSCELLIVLDGNGAIGGQPYAAGEGWTLSEATPIEPATPTVVLHAAA
jgi:hypothetical protein